MYTFYLTTAAKKQLTNLQPHQLRLFIKNLQYIQKQKFHGGTRLKKLRTNLDIWETRIDLSLRMLFSMTNENIYIRYIAISHDEVNKKLKTLNPHTIENAEILNILNKIENEYITDSNTSTKQEVFYELNHHLLDNLYQNLDLKNVDLKLKLFPQQEQILLKPMPLLIDGVAGSGKSTIILYKILLTLNAQKAEGRLPNIYYLTENNNLLKQIKKHLYQLYPSFSLETEDLKNIKCLSIETYFKDNDNSIYLCKNDFFNFYWKYILGDTAYEKYDAEYYYNLVQQIQLLNAMYQWPLEKSFTYLNKNDTHVQQLYNAYIKFKKTKEAKDLADFMIQHDNKKAPIDFLFIDEVQDYPQLFLERLFKEVKVPTNIMLVGDLDQQISQSNFNWNDVKSYFFKSQNKIEMHKLAYNFRNSVSVTMLLNQLLNVRKQFSKINAVAFKALNKGPKPNIKKASLASLNTLNSFVFIVPNKEVEETVLKILGKDKALVLTPALIKGLEFPNICLVNFNSTYKKLLNPLTAESVQILKEMYVAASRTQKHLYIHEEETIEFWITHCLKELDFTTINMENLANEISDETWYKNATELYNLGAFEKSLYCLNQIQLENRFEEIWKLYFEINKTLQKEISIDFNMYPLARKAYETVYSETTPHYEIKMQIQEFEEHGNVKALTYLYNQLIDKQIEDIDIINASIKFYKKHNLRIKQMHAIALKAKIMNNIKN